jgi:pimeloyl-ACP methyl ester carboxylesterase
VDVVPRTAAELFHAGHRASWAHNAVGAADHEALIRDLSVPLLGLAGTREGLRTQTAEACGLSPWARFEEMGDVGGFVADEAPADLADAVTAFLRLPDASVIPTPSGADR